MIFNPKGIEFPAARIESVYLASDAPQLAAECFI